MAKDLISRKRKPTTGDSSIGKSAKKQKPQKKDTKKKVESSDESDDGKRKKIVHEEEGDDNHDDVQEEEIEDGNDFGDGLANTMAALLKQTTKSKVIRCILLIFMIMGFKK